MTYTPFQEAIRAIQERADPNVVAYIVQEYTQLRAALSLFEVALGGDYTIEGITDDGFPMLRPVDQLLPLGESRK